MKDSLNEFYSSLLTERGFLPVPSGSKFSTLGQTFALSSETGNGYYWVYTEKDLFDIKIHDFYFHEDYIFECNMPECLSVTYYYSISGHELNPYRRINANCVKSYLGGYTPYKAMIHKKIPVKSVGIEILPEYYNNYLKEKYPAEYISPYKAFCAIDETSSFPEMTFLLNQVWDYRGSGISAKLFYEAKVAEAVSLVVERFHKLSSSPKHLSKKDLEQLHNVTAYINDHAAFPLPLDQLAKIACMGITKLKQTFKQVNGCTITEYIQQQRMEQAEFLLSHTDLSISQISQTVGYSNASRFAELFQRNVGILPGEYRKIMN
ncbi:helix-turn-helix transcriptional regulator [Anaerocolumna xylanovorans]|uniref:Transcriptional regulator, AraC family n=1 Tax=Anaerocolumna xylanovorans DSM 12503 TaxID=1121345 RepID=A0A1M7YM38_9FIRM|nr:AraC family transcriptional regulator [Anaerocolumna xylanovorans]SHO53667.1 transcriptional regulator, AraC family [Anaerocolumna xylanovorans DSM 12503]